MRRNLIAVLALGAALAVAFTAVATAKFDRFVFGNVVLLVDGGVSPKALPKKRMAPVRVRVAGKISTRNGAHPPAFREALIDFDKNGTVNARGLAVCKGGQLQARNTRAAKRVCGKTIVGKGSGRIQISFPEQRPILIKAPITVFNGGVRRGTTTLFIHTFITVPVPAAVVTTVKIKRVRKGRYGVRTISKIPVIAGGSGSVLDFNINFGRNFKFKGKRRSYIRARCADGRFLVKIIRAVFKDEAGVGGGNVNVSGNVVRRCRQKGR